MKEETIVKYIDKLAESLNVASEHVYGVLLKQAQIYAAMSGVTAVVLLVIVGLLIYYAVKSFRLVYVDGEDEMWLIISTVLGLAAIVLGFIGVAVMYDAITAAFNPEYKVLKDIIDAVK